MNIEIHKVEPNSELSKKIVDLEKANSDFSEKCTVTEGELQQTRDELNRVNGELSYLKGKNITDEREPRTLLKYQLKS